MGGSGGGSGSEVVGTSLQDATGGIQLLAAVYMAMLGSPVLGDTGKLIKEKTKKKKWEKENMLHGYDLRMPPPPPWGWVMGGHDERPPKLGKRTTVERWGIERLDTGYA